jgi:hypothetical protein
MLLRVESDGHVFYGFLLFTKSIFNPYTFLRNVFSADIFSNHTTVPTEHERGKPDDVNFDDYTRPGAND